MADFEGTSGNDTFNGTETDEEITGLDGNDDLGGGAGDDIIDGGKGNDTLRGGVGDDTLRGREGDDRFIDTGGGNDVMGGGDGANVYEIIRDGASNSDSVEVNGGSGTDTLTFTGNAANDASIDVDLGKGDNSADITDAAHAVVEGGRGVDTLDVSVTQGGSIRGGGGNDVINAAIGADGYLALSLGAGDDRLTLNTDRGGEYRLSLNEGKAGAGKDVVTLDAPEGDADTVRIVAKHFSAGDSGDKFDFTGYLKSVLEHFRGSDNPFDSGHLRLVQTGDDARLQIDIDGAARDAHGWTDFIVFKDMDVDDLTAFNLGGYDPDAGA
ncbi:MAG TPA: hypothetical protein VF559_00045 [Caulobacteraceae bacterium]|jgi:hypothetical protein